MPKVPSLRHCFEHFDPPRSPVARIDDRGGTPFWGGDRSVFSWGFVLNVFWEEKEKGGGKFDDLGGKLGFFSDILEDFRVSDLCFPFNYGNSWCPFGPLNLHLFLDWVAVDGLSPSSLSNA